MGKESERAHVVFPPSAVRPAVRPAARRLLANRWTWLAFAYLAVLVAYGPTTGSLGRFVGFMGVTTLVFGVAVWSLVVWRIVFTTRYGDR